jgi:hypothetical protein
MRGSLRGKRLELIGELLGYQPSKVAWIGNPDEVSAKRNLAVMMQSAEKLGVKVERWEVRKPDDLDRVFVATTGWRSHSGSIHRLNIDVSPTNP